MNKSIFAILTACVAIAYVPGAQASEETATYTGASPGLVGIQWNDYGGLLPGDNLGGYHFFATGAAPTGVSVHDASGNPVYFTACQDTNGNSLCGEAGEPKVNGCGGSAVLPTTGSGAFSASRDTIVFVYSTNLPSCIGTATTGTITLTYNP
jgi:hypothetical protein